MAPPRSRRAMSVAVAVLSRGASRRAQCRTLIDGSSGAVVCVGGGSGRADHTTNRGFVKLSVWLSSCM